MESRRDIRRFIEFPEKLYRDNPYYVPKLVFDQMNTLDQRSNPAAEFCDSALYMAFRDGEAVGRIAVIVNRKANEQWNHQEVRFGWYDFIDDREVSKALMDKAVEFGRERGMDDVVGPLGFTDFDPEGMLVEGFDRMSTMALIYNHPYYNDHMAAMGFEKDADWIEYKMFFNGEPLPERMQRISAIVGARAKVHLRPVTRKIMRKENYGQKVFHCINECYKNLYNYTVMPDEMASKYIDFYLKLLNLDRLAFLENEEGELVGFGITMPSIAHALQKCRGKLFPFGWFHLIKALYGKNEGNELLLIGVRPDYQNTGINSMLVAQIFGKFGEYGVKWAESNAVLETNTKNQAQFEGFNTECVKRRRSYKLPINQYK